MSSFSMNFNSSEHACARCETGIEFSSRTCSVCQSDAGYPNVRAAQGKDEVHALNSRVAKAKAAVDPTARSRLDSFESSLLQSKVVIARSLEAVYDLVRSDTALYVSFHRAFEAGQKIPLHNKWDQGRAAAEGVVFPNYYRDIIFGALSLDGSGARAYGEYSVILKDKMIEHRSTVFEENPFSFNRKHRVYAGKSAPKGYRATWENRASVAVAKLASQINANTEDDQFRGILLQQGATTGKVECVEVHCFGSIHRRAIEKVKGPKPRSPREEYFCEEIDRHLTGIGATLELI